MSRAAWRGLFGLGVWLAAGVARAEAPVQRTFFQLASSNGHGAVLLDLEEKKLTHFREHLVATEEPLLDGSGDEVWSGNQPQSVASRDLLYDAYFGLRAGGTQGWLTGAAVDLDKSGYVSWSPGANGGTGLVQMVQSDASGLEVTTYAFAPRALAGAGFVMAARVVNTGSAVVTGVSMFSLHNLHLGFGRPGAMQDIGEQGETVGFDGAGHDDFLERGFAGVVAARALAVPAHHGASNAASPSNENVFTIVDGGGTADLPDLDGEAPTADGSVSAFQWDLGDLAAGEERWVGVALAHHADPFAGATAEALLDDYVAGRAADDVVSDEVAAWATFQGGLSIDAGLDAGEEALVRQSAVMLAMAQCQDSSAYLREFLTTDGEPRYTRFGATLGGPPATLPATIAHRAAGQVIASLPPGEWTVSWSRDMAYSATAMAALGLGDEARRALEFTMNAEAGRFQSWNELSGYGVGPYQVSLVRYYGFGVEETDFNDFGPNLEFDGLGLFLWAAHHYEELTGDASFVDDNWPVISEKVADVLVGLVDPETGLLHKDSSIWESHWDGRERTWSYTNITAVRGLCDAALLADRVGDAARAATYRDTAMALREAIAARLTDASHALASNAEELATGTGYWDAAVLEAIAMGLFDPKGVIATATFDGLDEQLQAPAGAGWSRNDDRFDHAGADDTSPWGSEYDSAEWVVTDLRGAVAARLMGNDARADRLVAWVRDQSLENYLAVSETYDEADGTYKFNAPMIGFGAGAFALASAARSKALDGPACGAYFDEGGLGSTGEGGSSGSGASGGEGGAFLITDPPGSSGCGCRVAGDEATAGASLACAALAMASARRRRRRRRA